MDNGQVVKFGQDLFRLCGEKGFQVIDLSEENGHYFIQTPTESDFSEVLEELLADKWKLESKLLDSTTNTWKWEFTLEDGALDNYNYQFVDKTIDVTELDILEENEDKTVTKVEGPHNNIIHFDDGTIQIDLGAWAFEIIERQVGNLMKPMEKVGMILTFDWTELVGHFMSDDEFEENELIHTGSQTGRWAIKGVSPFGKEVFFIIHDENAGDIPIVQSSSTYGLLELGEWFQERFKDHQPCVYEREVKLSDGSVEKYGIDDTGKPYNTWNRCGWLKELGL